MLNIRCGGNASAMAAVTSQIAYLLGRLKRAFGKLVAAMIAIVRRCSAATARYRSGEEKVGVKS
jgi:hypothetical protein